MEQETPPETGAEGPEARLPNTPGWIARTFPNKFPSLRPDAAAPDPETNGSVIAGAGPHEVLVETPRHFEGLAEAPQEQVEALLRLMSRRLAAFAEDPQVRYQLWFRNFGNAAGASLGHPHSQLMGFPMVPPRVERIRDRKGEYWRTENRCLGCDQVRELESSGLVVAENSHFVAGVRWAGRFPFEAVIWPRRHRAQLPAVWKQAELSALASIWREMARRYNAALGRPAWNTILVNAPLREESGDWFHWHLELFPRLSGLAGVELGVEMYVNPSDPAAVAARLREV